jgi:hypothetical protein
MAVFGTLQQAVAESYFVNVIIILYESFINIFIVVKLNCAFLSYGRGGERVHFRDRMVVGFTTTCAISAFNH